MAPTRKPPAKPSRRSERMQLATTIKFSEQEAKAKEGITKKKCFRRPRQRAGCRLLNLRGEIRNNIYRFALLQPETVKIEVKCPGKPSLLRACKRISTEAKSIYYTENRFSLQLLDFNGVPFVPFMRQYNRTNFLPKQGKLTFNMRGSPNWANLAEWVKADHAGANMQPAMEDCVVPNDLSSPGRSDWRRRCDTGQRPSWGKHWRTRTNL